MRGVPSWLPMKIDRGHLYLGTPLTGGYTDGFVEISPYNQFKYFFDVNRYGILDYVYTAEEIVSMVKEIGFDTFDASSYLIRQGQGVYTTKELFKEFKSALKAETGIVLFRTDIRDFMDAVLASSRFVSDFHNLRIAYLRIGNRKVGFICVERNMK